MSYTHEPPTISPLTRPLVFRNTRTSSAQIEYAVCSIYVNTGLKAIYRKPWLTSGANFLFDIDVQSVVERNAAPYATQQSSLFYPLATKGLTSNTDVFVEYYLDMSLEARNSSGFLEAVSGSSEVSSTLYGIPASRPLYSVNLNDYYQPSAGGDFMFLTTAPAEQYVDTSDSFMVSWLSRGTNAAQLIFYNSAGSSAAQAVIATASSTADERMNTLTIGPANILGTGSVSVLNGALPSAFDAISYYTYSAGEWAASTYTRKSELRTLRIAPRCDWAQRLYWMGELGGIEQYTFGGRIVKKQRDGGTIGELAPGWDISLSPPVQGHSRGLFKADMESEVVYEIAQPVTPEEGAFLRSLRKSPEVYLEVGEKYQAVTIEPGETDFEGSRDGVTEMRFRVLVDREAVQQI